MWFNHVWFLYSLQRGGYPFAKNDLSVDEWTAIGELREALEMEKNAAPDEVLKKWQTKQR
jgi:hypothetical protein